MKKLIITHAGCVDGFTAAWAVVRSCGLAEGEYEVVHARHGDPPPSVAGRDVLIVDFSYPRETLVRMHAEAERLFVLDHHKTAQADLEGLDFCVFDMERSGAGLAWDAAPVVWAPEQQRRYGRRPELVGYVEDRDLWRFALPHSKAISAYIATKERTFEAWDDLELMLQHNFSEVVGLGETALAVVEQHVRSVLGREPRLATIGGHRVPCVNCTFAVSEVVGALAEAWPLPGFAAGWFQREDGKFVYSLRSRGDFDVSEVARQYGGGGHKSAAGFVSKELLT